MDSTDAKKDFNVNIRFGANLDPALAGDLEDSGRVTGTSSVNGDLKAGVTLEGFTEGASFGKTKEVKTKMALEKFDEGIGPVADANMKVTKLEGLLSFQWDPAKQKVGDKIEFSTIGVEVAGKGKTVPIPEPAFVQLPLLLIGAAVLLRGRRRELPV